MRDMFPGTPTVPAGLITTPRPRQPVPTAEAGRELAATADRLRRLLPGFSDVYALDEPLGGRRWVGVERLVQDGHLEAMLTAVRRQGGGAAYPAAAVGASLAQAVAGRLAASLARERRGFDTGSENLLVRPAAQGHLDGVALRRPTLAVLAGDRTGALDGVAVFESRHELLTWCAHRVVATLTPLFAALRDLSRFGVVPLWNLTSDAVLTSATLPALFAGGDQRAERQIGEELLDALVAAGARVSRRGRVQQVLLEQRSVLAPVRGSCCLVYRLAPGADPQGEGYCTTCPLVADRDRARRYGTWVRDYVLGGNASPYSGVSPGSAAP